MGAAGQITSSFVVDRQGQITDRDVALMALPATLAGAAPAWATFPGDNGNLLLQRPVGEKMDPFTSAAGT